MSASEIKRLKDDIVNINKASSSILSHALSASPSIAQCPSRKYPSKLAKDIVISPEDTLENTEHEHLLDLTLDRLLFLIQCTVSILGSNTPPLSLGTAVKKLAQLLTATGHPVSVTKFSNTDTPPRNGTPITCKLDQSGLIKSAATQTIETSFGTCMYCSEMQNVLLDVACSFTEAFHKLNTHSKIDEDILSSYDIDSHDIIPANKWTNSFEQDVNRFSEVLNSLKTKICHQELEMEEVKTNLQSKLTEVRNLETKLTQINRENEQCQENLKLKLHQSNEKLQTELELVSKERNKMKIENTSFISQLNSQNEEKDSNSLLNSKLKIEINEMEIKLNDNLKGLQIITAKCDSLEERAHEREEEKQTLLAEIENMSVQIKKLEIQSSTMKQHEGKMRSKFESLVKQIDSVSEDYTKLQDDWSTLTDENGRFKLEISEKESAITETKAHLANQEKIVEDMKERDFSYSEQVQQLEVAISAVKSELQAAGEKCRLLMKFPEIFPTTYTAADIHEMLLANSLKIMLLEQNSSQLRQENLKQSLSSIATDSSQDFTLVEPTQLWHMQDLNTLKREFSLRLNSDTSCETIDKNFKYLEEDDIQFRVKSRGRGRCGHLKEALAHVSSQEECLSSSPQRGNVKLVWSEQLLSTTNSNNDSIAISELDKSASELMPKQLHTCQICDSMFYDMSSLITHNQHCHSALSLNNKTSL